MLAEQQPMAGISVIHARIYEALLSAETAAISGMVTMCL
jgi:hypothetical protein